MAEGRIKGITIEIDGDVTGLNKALESTNKELRSSQKQLNDVNRLLKLDPTNTELLAQKQRLLGESIESTRDRLSTLKKAEEQTAAKLGSGGKEAREQYEALRREIISTENKLENLEGQAGETEKALEDAGEDGAEKIKDAGNAAKDAESKVSGFGNAAKAAGVAAAAAFAAATAAAIAAGKALVNMTAGGAEYADEVLTLSTQTGIATDKLQEYMYAAEIVDVSVETLTKSMAKNIKSMKSASDGSAAYAEAYEQLGISVVDVNGELRDSEKVYWESIEALGKIENETERDALAMQLFGKSAQELNPLIAAGAKKMQELGSAARDAGYVIDSETLGAYGALDDQLQYLSAGATAAKNALGTILLPVLKNLAGEGVDLLGEFTQGVLAANGDISKMSDVVGKVLPKVADMFMRFIPELIEIAGELISAFLGSIIGNLPKITDAAVNIITTLVVGLTDSFPQIISAAVSLLKSLLDAIVDNLPGFIDGIISAAMAIVDAIPEILDAIVAALPKIINTLIKALPEVIRTLANAITKLSPEFIKAGIELAKALLQGIVDALSDPRELISTVAQLGVSISKNLFGGIFAWIGAASGKTEKKILQAFPSKELSQKTGEEIGGAVASGILKSETKIESAANDVSKTIVDAASRSTREVEVRASEIISAAAEAADAFAEMQAQTATDFSKMQSYYVHISELTEELFALAGANGEVEEADRARVSFILGELNNALGTEYALTGDTIDQYEALKDSIYDVIAAKRANTLLDAYEDDYRTALKNHQSSIDAVSASQDEYNEKLREYKAVQDEIRRFDASGDQNSFRKIELNIKSEEAYTSLAEAELAYLQAVDNLQLYEGAIQKYEGAMTKLMEGDYEGAEKVLNSTTDLVRSSDRTMINDLKSSLSLRRKEWQDELSNGSSYLSRELRNSYTDVVDYSNGIYREALGIGENIENGMTTGLDGTADTLTAKTKEIIRSAIGEAGNEAANAKSIGENIGQGLADGIYGKMGIVQTKAVEVARSALGAMRNVLEIASPSKATTRYGVYLDAGLAEGMDDGMTGVLRVAENLTDSILSRLSFDPAVVDFSPAVLSASPTANYSTVHSSSVSLGGVNVYVSAQNVDNVESLADLIADKINTDIINRQAVYG